MFTNYLKSKFKQFQPQFKPPITGYKSWFSLSTEERTSANNKIIDEKIIRWNNLINRSQRVDSGNKGNFHILFPHIPKTGGTTLDYIIAKNYKVDFVYRANANSIERNLASIYKMHNNFKVHRTLMGHFQPSDYLYQLLDRKKLVQLVLLRNPVSRVISYYDYSRSSPNHPKYRLAKRMSLADFVNSPQIDDVCNGQTYRILGWLKDNYWQNHPYSNEAVLELAKTQLMTRYSMFGVTEQYDLFLLMAQRLLGWQDIYYQRKNKSNVKTDKGAIDDDTKTLILDKNSLDMALYQFINKKLAVRSKQLGISDKQISYFQTKNNSYSDLLATQYL